MEVSKQLKEIHRKMRGVTEAEILAALGVAAQPVETTTGTTATAVTFSFWMS